MPKKIELTGQNFGKLKVIAEDTERTEKKGRAYWLCECECGNIISVGSDKLRSGHTKSCGCLKFEKREDLTNKVFGFLKVIEIDKNQHKDGAVWKCKCLLCNNPELISVKAVNLKTGHTKSCGCLATQFHRRDTIKDLTGDIYGFLKVIKSDENRSHKGKGMYWLCKCLNCNSDKLVSKSGASLRNGHVISCGCIKSKGEKKIAEILNKNHIIYEEQYKFKDLYGKNQSYPLSFDFAIFKDDSLIALIEYQGELHYEAVEYFGGEEGLKKQQEYDNKKRIFCQKNNIKLIEIPYTDYNNLSLEYIQKMIDYGE